MIYNMISGGSNGGGLDWTIRIDTTNYAAQPLANPSSTDSDHCGIVILDETGVVYSCVWGRSSEAVAYGSAMTDEIIGGLPKGKTYDFAVKGPVMFKLYAKASSNQSLYAYAKNVVVDATHMRTNTNAVSSSGYISWAPPTSGAGYEEDFGVLLTPREKGSVQTFEIKRVTIS